MKVFEKRFRVEALTDTIEMDGPEVQHMRVLRLKAGDEIHLFDGTGWEARARIEDLDAFTVTMIVLERFQNDLELPQPVTLALALLKGDKLADVVRACTELGVSRFQLIKTQYADVPDLGDNKLVRLRRIAEEASKQSRRAVVPEVLAPISLKQLPSVPLGFVAHPGTQDTVLSKLSWDGQVWFATGPEGGFSASEVELLKQKNFTPVTLGKRILRAETAPVALLGAVVSTGV
ncbi:16S rRNA (uracil(1498)-N(3))-methyltransferase [Deinococcus cellulosilyticus]|uniref:Ribosomal RNA small subunit methyltransferase E n=1 Tax=Deinococcus cellulosilyticus (strain DSM 18568 / NBRC 106333 / KACC 11606 / 5516J-15) TaxID=1223518 RepID=A0A511MWQ6_DEIC1|nr:16S rRNA (uracil(1498)-N(3))-methyltransferase [Deinococcus cellulosilyticus]GEM45012.1 ribosomal RNA small subunit methyltransferase E [Deinococcus cellulosilyticus NBRC 106333 = KACC 11606]